LLQLVFDVLAILVLEYAKQQDPTPPPPAVDVLEVREQVVHHEHPNPARILATDYQSNSHWDQKRADT
jgi:hypothetical protein